MVSVIYFAQDFRKFVVPLQTSKPMLPMLYKFRKLLCGNLSKFMKDDVIFTGESKELIPFAKLLQVDIDDSKNQKVK